MHWDGHEPRKCAESYGVADLGQKLAEQQTTEVDLSSVEFGYEAEHDVRASMTSGRA